MVYTEKPDNFKLDWEVVGCFVEVEKECLLLQRQLDKSEPGTYGLVGGKVDTQDTDMYEAMVRELQEETGIIADIKDLAFINTVYVENFNYKAIFHLFILTLSEKPTIQISADEHQGYIWTSYQEMKQLPLMEDLVPCIDILLDH